MCMTMTANKHMDLSRRIVIEKMFNDWKMATHSSRGIIQRNTDIRERAHRYDSVFHFAASRRSIPTYVSIENI
jgi:hypothetical protein